MNRKRLTSSTLNLRLPFIVLFLLIGVSHNILADIQPIWFADLTANYDKVKAVMPFQVQLINSFNNSDNNQAIVNKGETGLMVNCYEGKPDFVKLFLDYGANIHAKARAGEHPGDTALHLAAENPNTNPFFRDIMEMLIKQGANVAAKGLSQQTPMHRVAAYLPCGDAILDGRIDLMRLLLRHGGDINAKDDKGDPVIKYGTIDPSSFLWADKIVNEFCPIMNSTRVNLKNDTVLQAARRPPDVIVEIADTIRRFDINRVRQIKEWNSPSLRGLDDFIFAILRDDEQWVKRLIRPSNLNTSNINTRVRPQDNIFWAGNTPLHFACLFGRHKLIPLFLQAGAEVNAVNANGETPLMLINNIAQPNDRVEAIELLLSRGAKLNLQDKDGNTLLHWAVMHGDEVVVRYLLARKTGEKLMRDLLNKKQLTPYGVLSRFRTLDKSYDSMLRIFDTVK